MQGKDAYLGSSVWPGHITIMIIYMSGYRQSSVVFRIKHTLIGKHAKRNAIAMPDAKTNA